MKSNWTSSSIHLTTLRQVQVTGLSRFLCTSPQQKDLSCLFFFTQQQHSVKEVTELLHITNLHKNPDGSKKYPALNCRDLRMFHPNLKSGELFFICQTFRNYSHPSQHHPQLQLYHFVLLLKNFFCFCPKVITGLIQTVERSKMQFQQNVTLKPIRRASQLKLKM